MHNDVYSNGQTRDQKDHNRLFLAKHVRMIMQCSAVFWEMFWNITLMHHAAANDWSTTIYVSAICSVSIYTLQHTDTP